MGISVHNKQDWTDHKRSLIRPLENVAIEIFSFDHQYTKSFTRDNINAGFNYSKVNHRYLKCIESKDKYTSFTVELDYDVQAIGEYRIDLLYENKNGKDYVGRYDFELTSKSSLYINTKPVTYKTVTKTVKTGKTNKKIKQKVPQVSTAHRIKGADLKFDGEKNFLKRNTVFMDINELGKYHLTVELPYNCYFVGVIIRKVITFTGDALQSAGTNISVKECEFTLSNQAAPIEANFEIGYNRQFDNPLTQSGFYMDYMDEVNIYVKEDGLTGDTSKQDINSRFSNMARRFGGYLSSIKSNDDNTNLTISCADRLIDGNNLFILDSMFILGTTSTDIEFYNPITFNSYPEALKFLCDTYQVTLDSNIKKNFLVAGEKYSTAKAIKFGKKKDIKKVSAHNMTAKVNNNFITIRNNASGAKSQSVLLYNGKDHSKKPINITNHTTFHMIYGLGDPKTESKQTSIETVSDGGSGSQKFNKYGVSADKNYIMAIGRASANGELGKYGYSFYKKVFKRKCPACGSTELYWYIFWAGNESSNWGTFPATGRGEGGSAEGHVFCKGCDADWSIFGKPHGGTSKHLEGVSKLMSSSKSEAYQLREGKVTAVPSNPGVSASEDTLKTVANIAKKYRYNLDTGASTYSAMKQSGVGECWAFSDLIFTELKKRKVSCRICQYPTSMSERHRTVVYKNSKGQWVNFPYKKYGLSRMLYPTSKCNPNKWIKEYKGNNIDGASTSSSSSTQTTTVTTTKGYDRDKPIQCYVEITYSTSPSWTAKKKKINLDFTLKAGTNNDWTGLSNNWINNAMRQSSVNMKGFFDDTEPGKQIYLQSIRLVTPKIKKADGQDKAEWYTYDKSTHDESSCKMDLYQILFDDRMALNPTDLQSCGKTVSNLLQDIVKASGYRVSMTYGKHRYEDKINFSVNDQTEPAFIATEGDNNNILDWSNISYSPVADLRNKSTCVFKNAAGKYEYVETADLESILRYGEQTTLQTSSEQISSKEAYFNARNSADYNPEQEYSYTIVIPYAPHLQLGDLIQVISNSKKLNDVKTLESLKVKFNVNQIPKLQSELGLNELEPFLRIRKEQEKLRDLTRNNTTVFSSTATPVDDEEVYIWDN